MILDPAFGRARGPYLRVTAHFPLLITCHLLSPPSKGSACRRGWTTPNPGSTESWRGYSPGSPCRVPFARDVGEYRSRHEGLNVTVGKPTESREFSFPFP